MSALNDLAGEVRFRERMRGYDYDEVDRYVQAVNQAVVQATEQIDELNDRLRQLESDGSREDEMNDTRDTLLRTLVLAQRTADTAVAEAHSEAKTITDAAQGRAARTVSEAEAAANARMRSAEEKAAQTLAEGEENCRLIIAETKRTAAIEIAAERERWHQELRGLAVERADLEETSARIRVRLEDERERLHNLMTSFRAFVEEIDPGQVMSPPEIPAAEAPGQEQPLDPIPLQREADPPADPHWEEEAVVEASQNEPQDNEPQDNEPQDNEPQDNEPQDNEPQDNEPQDNEPQDNEPQDNEPQDNEPQDNEPQAPLSHPGNFDPVPEVPMVRWLDDPEPPDDTSGQLPLGATTAVAQPPQDDPASPPAMASPGDPTEALVSAVTQSWPVLNAEAPSLFDADADEDDEFIEQLRRVVSRDAPLPDSSVAMSAFFDHDEDRATGGDHGRGGGPSTAPNPTGGFLGRRSLRP